MRKKLISSIVGFLTLIFMFGPAWAQFSPGKEGVGVGGGDTQLEMITQVAPGKAVLHTVNIYAVFLDSMPIPAGVQVHFTEADYSGKGTSRVASTTNPALKLFFCWRGAGGDWEKQACASIVNGNADVTIDVGETRGQIFSLTPVILENPNDRQIVAWGSHPQNTRRLLECPGMKNPDMRSIFVVDPNGRIRVAFDKEATRYQKHYATFCQR